ncbi:hypothetical protein WJX82_004454 [Trebouxia sp. C0006]
MPQHHATGAGTSAAAGLSFGKSITFQHVGGASPTPPHAITNSLPGRDSGPSVGPSTSLGNWLPQPDSSMAELPQVLSGPAKTPARSKADKRRRQCLLEIEHELLRHSSSDEEGCGGDDMQLPNPSAGKRSKSACTAGRVVDLFAGL